MKVLWFEVTTPGRYTNENAIIAGWQDSLENIIKEVPNVELYISFISPQGSNIKVIDGITYIPISLKFSFSEKIRKKVSWAIDAKKTLTECLKVVEMYQPDIIHVFGCEWPFGLIASKTDIPVVIHIQGSIVPYYNALYPPKYNGFTLFRSAGLNLKKHIHNLLQSYRNRSNMRMEKVVWKRVSNYMGRTDWDYALTQVMNPSAKYFHVEEALRNIFYDSNKKWAYKQEKRIKIISTGCSTYWKGVDVMLKTAYVLKCMGIDFEWNVAGKMSKYLRKTVEKKEGMRFEDFNVKILGYIPAEKLVDLLIDSSMMVHTAYIENSPNSICEAQCLGVPIIATYVGGIPSLIHHGVDGELVQANDPWQIAYRIVSLSKDEKKLCFFSENARREALKRHSPANIRKQLMDCYQSIIRNTQSDKNEIYIF